MRDEPTSRVDPGAISLMVTVGHRAGLFDALAALAPSTCTAIAARASVAERHVREWLAVMASAGIVAFDPAGRTYAFAQARAADCARQPPFGVATPDGAQGLFTLRP